MLIEAGRDELSADSIGSVAAVDGGRLSTSSEALCFDRFCEPYSALFAATEPCNKVSLPDAVRSLLDLCSGVFSFPDAAVSFVAMTAEEVPVVLTLGISVLLVSVFDDFVPRLSCGDFVAGPRRGLGLMLHKILAFVKCYLLPR